MNKVDIIDMLRGLADGVVVAFDLDTKELYTYMDSFYAKKFDPMKKIFAINDIANVLEGLSADMALEFDLDKTELEDFFMFICRHITEESTASCSYIIKKGLNKGKQCGLKSVNNTHFCSKHTNVESCPLPTDLCIMREPNLKVWIIKGQNKVVKSPKDPTIYAHIVNGKIQKTYVKPLPCLKQKQKN